MTPRELIEQWEREAKELRKESEKDKNINTVLDKKLVADIKESHAAELRAALPEQPLAKQWREEAKNRREDADLAYKGRMYVTAGVLRGCVEALDDCASDLDAQYDEDRALLREVMQEHKGRCACPENYGKHLEKRCVWCRIRKHLGGER